MRSLMLLVVPCLCLVACSSSGNDRPVKPPPLSARQRAAMQTKELEGDLDTGFSATISVLQDEGWQVDVVDKPSGVIQASSLKQQDVIGPGDDWLAERDGNYRARVIQAGREAGRATEWTRWARLTVHIEMWGRGRIRQRITITRCGQLPSDTFSFDDDGEQRVATRAGKEQSVVVEDPVVYQHLFQKIQRAVFVRQGLTGKK